MHWCSPLCSYLVLCELSSLVEPLIYSQEKVAVLSRSPRHFSFSILHFFSKPFFFSYLFWICVFFLRTCWSSCPFHDLFGVLMADHFSNCLLFIVVMYLFPSRLQGYRSYSCVKRAVASSRKLCDHLCGNHMLEVCVFLSWLCCKIPSSWIFRVTYCSLSVSLFFWWYK